MHRNSSQCFDLVIVGIKIQAYGERIVIRRLCHITRETATKYDTHQPVMLWFINTLTCIRK